MKNQAKRFLGEKVGEELGMSQGQCDQRMVKAAGGRRLRGLLKWG